MKINFIVPEIVRSGGIRVIFEFANRLTANGHDVLVYTPMIPFNPLKPKLPFQILKHQLKYALKQMFGMPYLPENIFPYNFELKSVPFINNISIKDADATIATSWTTAYHVNNLSNLKGKKFYLIQGHEIWNSNQLKAENSYKLPLNRIVVSNFLNNLLLEKYSSRSHIIYPGINYDNFYIDKKVFNKFPVILFADHELGIKNIKGLITVIETIKQKYHDVKFKCFALRKYNKMPEYVEFINNPTDKELRLLYQGSDIFLFTSKSEGFGLPPAEAMACKCALVANAVAAIPEFSTHNYSAIHCDPNNPKELVNGVSYLIENRDEMSRIAENGYQDIRKLLNWDKSIEKFINLI